MTQPELPLTGALCRLRAFDERDDEALLRHANDPAIGRNLRDRFPHPYDIEDAREWIALTRMDRPATNLAIDVDGEVCGSIGIAVGHDIERVSAEIGYWLGRSVWGRGIATDALRLMTEYAFETFDLTRIWAVPFARNLASHRVLEKAGYLREGLLRRAAIKDGEIVGMVMYARVR
ncbi:N-acetyltransferase [Vulcanimicrobium alpinum]|uniref:N-acetyltransferase n=1 Tax=Vulcanimicrobium alpinum TaxID=3016050 RepID=A0AAN1XV37_UNVUL|nr:GNAT family N-acetyltransferase [Vulcanimicrobium alpinum]BDE05529.1 N-acetyltransferase [Vulcanimicrobium alpinum]